MKLKMKNLLLILDISMANAGFWSERKALIGLWTLYQSLVLIGIATLRIVYTNATGTFTVDVNPTTLYSDFAPARLTRRILLESEYSNKITFVKCFGKPASDNDYIKVINDYGNSDSIVLISNPNFAKGPLDLRDNRLVESKISEESDLYITNVRSFKALERSLIDYKAVNAYVKAHPNDAMALVEFMLTEDMEAMASVSNMKQLAHKVLGDFDLRRPLRDSLSNGIADVHLNRIWTPKFYKSIPRDYDVLRKHLVKFAKSNGYPRCLIYTGIPMQVEIDLYYLVDQKEALIEALGHIKLCDFAEVGNRKFMPINWPAEWIMSEFVSLIDTEFRDDEDNPRRFSEDHSDFLKDLMKHLDPQNPLISIYRKL